MLSCCSSLRNQFLVLVDDQPATPFNTFAMASQNSNNVNASGSSFTNIGRDQVHQVHVGRDQIIYNFSDSSTDSIASRWSNQGSRSRSHSSSAASGSQDPPHTRDRDHSRRHRPRADNESWTEVDLRDAYDALQDELPASNQRTSRVGILKRGMSDIQPSPFDFRLMMCVTHSYLPDSPPQDGIE